MVQGVEARNLNRAGAPTSLTEAPATGAEALTTHAEVPTTCHGGADFPPEASRLPMAEAPPSDLLGRQQQ